MTLMAVSLAACGSSDPVAIIEEIGAVDDTDAAADTADTTALAMTALQSQASTLLSTISASDAAVATASIAAGSSAAVMSASDLVLAPATVALATAAFDTLAGIVAVQMDPTLAAAAADPATGDGLEASNAVGAYVNLASTFATMLTAEQAVTQANITALTAAKAATAGAFAFEAASDANTVAVASVALVDATNAALAAPLPAGTAATAAQTAGMAGLNAVGAYLGGNSAAVLMDGDINPASAGEITAGQAAYGAVLHAAMLANDAAYATAYAATSAALQTADLDAMIAAVVVANTFVTDANTGLITSDTDVGASVLAMVGAAITTIPAASAVDFEVALNVALTNATVAATSDQASDASIIAN